MSTLELLQGLVAFILLGGLSWAAIAAGSSHQTTAGIQTRLFLTGYGIRFAFSLVLYVFGFVSVVGEFDSIGWAYGLGIDQLWTSEGRSILELPGLWLKTFNGTNQGYYYLVGTLFFVTGLTSRLAAAALNCCIGALTIVAVYRIALELFDEQIARRVGWWVCLFPSMVIWSAQTVKEPCVILLEAVALYACVRLRSRGFSLGRVVAAGLCVIALLAFRFYAAYVAITAVVAALTFPDLRRRRFSASSAVLVVLFVLATFSVLGMNVEREARLEFLDLEYMIAFRSNVAADSGSGVLTNFDMRTPTGFGLATVVGAAHLLLAPFPWQLGSGSVRMLLTTPELLYWWYLVCVGVIPGLYYAVRWRLGDVLPLLLFAGGMGLVYSMTFGNVGLVFRQRAQILPWLLVFASVGLELRQRRQGAVQS